MDCKAVLVARMNNNDLDTAPICPDVKQLPMETLVDAKPGMLVAGFPCQDVSTGGKQAGMKRAAIKFGPVCHQSSCRFEAAARLA